MPHHRASAVVCSTFIFLFMFGIKDMEKRKWNGSSREYSGKDGLSLFRTEGWTLNRKEERVLKSHICFLKISLYSGKELDRSGRLADKHD
jgi:hypothetical protein